MSVYSHSEVEEKVISRWKKEDVPGRARRRRKGAKPFFFMDGPPYATGSIHMGTAWNKIIKDVYLRFFRMRGFDAWDQPGYDTHGTPIETKVEKELGFRSKKDIEAYGVGRFVAKCREFATRHIGVMSQQFANLGVWMDWEKPYLTLDNEYIEGAWFTFKRAFGNGFLYKGKYPVHVCPRCETVVAYNEIEYAKQTDVSIYVKLRLAGEPNRYLVVWTTTPWTLPGNTGVMAHPGFTYVEAEMGNGEVWIVAKDRLQQLMEAIEAGYTIRREFPGAELEGLRYEGPLHDRLRLPDMPGAYRVILSDRYVNLEDGTGLVHTAPGHGKEDFDAGTRAGLPAICPVDTSGTLTAEAGKYAGKKARVVDEEIIRDLEESGMLVYKHGYTHDYPMCWRCDTPLLQVGVPQWFFKVTAVRDKLLSENAKVNWVPQWAGQRFSDWLENLGDWPVSRQRYWGIPLPIWECGCGSIEVIGSFAELKRRAGLREEIDFHKPAIDRVRLKCGSCGGEMARVPDVLDVWFDSGVCTWASLGYPRRKALFDKMWPSAFQTEGPDQFRGWWNSQMITGVLTFGRAPFRNVLLHGFVMDVKGIKLSKSKGNFIDPQQVLDKYGRDVFRFYLMANPAWNDFYFSWDEIKETARMFTVLWNSYLFVKTYAPERPGRMPQLMPEDRWILSRLHGLIGLSAEAEKFEVHKLVKGLADFILNDFSRWYIKIIRDRTSPWYEGKDKAGAQFALSSVLEASATMLAPVAPFLADWIFTDMFGKDSVHLQDWPKHDARMVDKALEEDMAAVEAITEAMGALRAEKGIKLRWPLLQVLIKPSPENAAKVRRAAKNLEGVIMQIGNVKAVSVVGSLEGGKDFPLGSLSLGEVLLDEALVRELVRQVQVARKEAGLMVGDRISITFSSDAGTVDTLKRMEEELKSGVGAADVTYGPASGKGKGQLAFKDVNVTFDFSKA